jgi:hypothetical protein
MPSLPLRIGWQPPANCIGASREAKKQAVLPTGALERADNLPPGCSDGSAFWLLNLTVGFGAVQSCVGFQARDFDFPIH